MALEPNVSAGKTPNAALKPAKPGNGGKKVSRRMMTPEQRAKGAVAKHQRGVFNAYLRGLSGQASHLNVARLEVEIAEIQTILDRGTKLRKVPFFKDKKRIGSVERFVALLPSDRLKLVARLEALHGRIEGRKSVKPDLHREFLTIIKDFAKRNNYSYQMLADVGVRPEDLKTAGLSA